MNRQKLTAVGVTPASFHGSMPGLIFEIWTPLNLGRRLKIMSDHGLDERETRMLTAVARLKPGASLLQARAECSSLANRVAQLNPRTNTGIGATLLPIRQGHFGGQTTMAGPLMILMAVCVLVFLIVCSNVASLLLARCLARRREFSVRLSMGASRATLVRQLLSESLILATLGALAGSYCAVWMSRWLALLAPQGAQLPISMEIPLNGEIFGFVVLLCVLACLVSGLVPAIQSARGNLNEALKKGGCSGGEGAPSEGSRAVLVVSEVAMTLVAIIGAGLFAKSFQMARQIHPGFDARNVLVAHLDLAAVGYSVPEQSRFLERLRDRLASQPRIISVSWADVVPLWFAGNPIEDVQVEGYVPAPNESMKVGRNLVDPAYMNLMRIPILEGRDFSSHDNENGSSVMIVNQTFSQRFFAGRTPIGHRVRTWDRWFTITGVARDSKYVKPNEAATLYFYAPFQQAPHASTICIYIRTVGEPEGAVAALRSAANGIDPNATVFDTMPLSDYIGAALYGQKLAAVMLTLLSLVALVLAATGLYSVVTYSVTQRTQEIGLRMALGARAADVLALIVTRGMRLTLVGVAIGVAASLVLTRLAGSLLINMSATDPVVFVAASLFLTVVALIANYLPARRATRIDPIEALRCE